MFKTSILSFILLSSLNSYAAETAYDCLGKFTDLDEGTERLMKFDYQILAGIDGEEEQVILGQKVYIDPLLTNEDTTGWTIEQLTSFETNFITEYSEKGCPNNPTQSPFTFSTSDKTNPVISINVKLTCGDGFGAGSVLTGYCTLDEGKQ